MGKSPNKSARATIEDDISAQQDSKHDQRRSVYSCPDCGGALWEFDEGFECHTGHRWSPDALLTREGEELRHALAVAVRLLKEKAMLLRQVANKAASVSEAGRLMREQADRDDQYASQIQREFLEPSTSRDDPNTVADAVRQVLRQMDRPPDD